MKSVWGQEATPPKFRTLEGDIKTDVLVIGGGITGILCTHMLKKAGVDCILAEADCISGGITKNTTAKLTYQHGLIYADMINRFGEDAAKLYFKANREALEEYKRLSQSIDCDFKECGFVVYSCSSREKIEKECDALRKIGCKAEFLEDVTLPIKVKGALRVEGQAQFNPLKFLYATAENLPIYERTKVLELKPNYAITKHGRIKAEKIIVATHFPFINKHGSYFLKMYQHRSYVIALKNAPVLSDMYVDESLKGLSFRSYNDMLILGGGSHRTGKKGGCWQELLDFARQKYPKTEEVCRWATQDCMTLDSAAYIGQYSKHTPNFYVATGFNKWGMTSAMVSAMILRDLLQGKENRYASVFSPSRTMLRPQLAVNAAESLMGILTPTAPRCPHMGCALKYNKEEHSWDCSCHGSRFTEEGNLIDNPATVDKEI